MKEVIALSAAAVALSVALLARYRHRNGYPETCQLVAMFLYPVKGLQGYQVETARCFERGLEHDRRFMIIDASRGNSFCTQREFAGMARIQAKIVEHELVLVNTENGSCIRIGDWENPTKERKTVRVWDSICDLAVDQGQLVADWLRAEMDTGRVENTEFRLVYMGDECKRPSSEGDFQVSFADNFPYIVANIASLEDLNSRIKAQGNEQVPMSRFRPVLVIKGLPAWAEDRPNTELHFANGIVIKIAKPCDRCKVTTIDQQTGEVSSQSEPLNTLRKFRRLGHKVNVYFASFATLASKSADGVLTAPQQNVTIKWQ